MERICPNPDAWLEVHNKIRQRAKDLGIRLIPPGGLAFNGWAHTTNRQKKARWDETVRWCQQHNSMDLISSMRDEDYHYGEFNDECPDFMRGVYD